MIVAFFLNLTFAVKSFWFSLNTDSVQPCLSLSLFNAKPNKNNHQNKLTLSISIGPVCVLYDVCTGQAKVSYFYLLIGAMKKNISGL